jgi:hypothetical protein
LKESQKPESTKADSEPNPNWTKENYDDAVFDKMLEHDDDGLEKINISFKASICAQGDGLAEWEGRQEYLRGLFGGTTNLEKLKKLSDDAFKFEELMAQGGANKWQSLKMVLAPRPSPQLSRLYSR